MENIDNKGLVFLDTETTGLENPILIQLAYKHNGNYFNKFYSPGGVPISIPAMAIHHITEDMVINKEIFSASHDTWEIQNLLNSNILVAHNAKFDIDVLAKYDIITDRYIDTLKIAKYLRPDLEQYNEQYLRYYLNLKFDDNINAHDALSDIKVLEKIFQKIKEEFSNNSDDTLSDDDIYKKMIDISTKPLLLYRCQFGKYKGELWENIPRDYLIWILFSSDITDEDIIYTTEYYVYGRNKQQSGPNQLEKIEIPLNKIQNEKYFLGEDDGKYYMIVPASDEKIAITGTLFWVFVYNDKKSLDKKLAGNRVDADRITSIKEFSKNDKTWFGGMMFDNENKRVFFVNLYNNEPTLEKDYDKLLVLTEAERRE